MVSFALSELFRLAVCTDHFLQLMRAEIVDNKKFSNNARLHAYTLK